MNVALGPDKIGERYSINSEAVLLEFQQIINERIEKSNPNNNEVNVPYYLFKKKLVTESLTDEVCSFYKAAGWNGVCYEGGFNLRKEVEASE